MSTDRKYFGTDGIRGKVGAFPITPDFIVKLGWAVGEVLGKRKHSHVIIGKDTRLSGYMIESALESGLLAAGCDVTLVGPIPTPGVAYLVKSLHADAGIVVSASHNPFDDNGIKFFDENGFKLNDEVELAIEALLDQPLVTEPPEKMGKAKRAEDGKAQYSSFCKQSIDTHSIEGLKIVVDCAHGAAYTVAPKVLQELGAEVIAIFDRPDGVNINQQCGAVHPQQLQKEVISHHADLGIAFDGDADRLILVDEYGQLLDGDEILFILAKSMQESGRLKGGVVGTLMTNLGLELALNALDIPLVRTKVGDRYVLDELKVKGWNLGGETSGHILCFDKSTTGDALIAALQVIEFMLNQQKKLSELRVGMNKLAQAMINVQSANAQACVKQQHVLDAVQEAERILARKGRIVLRPSGTEPLVRVMVEGEDMTTIHEVAAQIAKVVESSQ